MEPSVQCLAVGSPGLWSGSRESILRQVNGEESRRALPILSQLRLLSWVIKHGITKYQPGTHNLDPSEEAISTR